MRLTAELASGYEPIDGQHRVLLDRLQDGIDAARAGDCAATKRALTALGDFLVAHFRAEEEMMSESAYPERTRHKAAHDLFMQDFAQLDDEVGTNGLTPLAVSWLETRLPEWLKFHVQVNDAPLGRYLSRRAHTAVPRPADKPRAC